MNYISLCTLPIILPILFWAGYHYHKDRHLPEPAGHLLLAFILGVGSFYLGLLMYEGLGVLGFRYDAFLLAEQDLLHLLIYSLLAIGPIEELAKLVPFLLIVIHFREFDEPIDGIIYASFIALGFGLVENFRYLRGLDTFEAWARGFAGPAIHVVFASIWGYVIGGAKLCRRPLFPYVVGALAFAAVVHGLYDYIVIGLAPDALPVSALIVLIFWFWRLWKIRELHNLPGGPGPEESQSA
jgi:RsiW-degrading membrane proteinase PrsW (M82 family)